MDKLQFDRINIEYLVAVIFLGIALLIGTYQGVETLAGNIAAGMVGYIGGRISAGNKEPPPTSRYNNKETFSGSVKEGK